MEIILFDTIDSPVHDITHINHADIAHSEITEHFNSVS